MAGSRTTTRLSTLHIEATQGYEDHAYLLLDSAGTIDVDGYADIDGTLDVGSTLLKSVDTTGSATSLAISDGQLSLVSHSGNSIVLAYRSGSTTYVFTNDAGGVL